MFEKPLFQTKTKNIPKKDGRGEELLMQVVHRKKEGRSQTIILLSHRVISLQNSFAN